MKGALNPKSLFYAINKKCLGIYLVASVYKCGDRLGCLPISMVGGGKVRAERGTIEKALTLTAATKQVLQRVD